MKYSFFLLCAACVFSACRANQTSSTISGNGADAFGPYQKYVIRTEKKGFEKSFLSLDEARKQAKNYLNDNPEEKIEFFERDSLETGSEKKLEESLVGDCNHLATLKPGSTSYFISSCSRKDLFVRCVSLEAARKIAANHEEKTGHHTGVAKE